MGSAPPPTLSIYNFQSLNPQKKQVDQVDDASDLCVQTQNFDPDQCNEG